MVAENIFDIKKTARIGALMLAVAETRHPYCVTKV